MSNYLAESLTIPSPVEEVKHPIADQAGIKLWVKREDLIHPMLSGNKWRKLKYLIQAYLTGNYSHAITFGGAYSNHIHAFAFACKCYNIPGVVIVRGERAEVVNPTISYLIQNNVEIHYVSRVEYRDKEDADEIARIVAEYSKPLVIPEGGSTQYAYKGMQEMVDEITMQKLSPDFIAISAGTGCSAGTMIYALRKSGINTEVFSVLKGIFMNVEVENWALDGNQYNVYTDYHQGGYAKVNAHYIDFINEFMAVTGIPVDPIYNGKLIYGLLSRIKDGCYKKGCNILWINTGGMQGVAGFNQRWKGQYRINIPS